MTEKIDRDLRLSMEFVMKSKPYSEADLMKKDFVTFLEMVKEAEAEMEKMIKEAEAINAKA